MANCINYDCDDDLGTHTSNECGEELLGGGSGMVLFSCDTQLTDPTSATQINDEIAAGRALLVLDLRIGIDEPAAVEIESNIVGGTTKLVTYNRSGNYIDKNVNANNVDLWNKINGGHSFGSVLVYIKGTEGSLQGTKAFYIDAPVSFTGGLPMKNQNDEFMSFKGKFTWRDKDGPALVAAPVGIF